MAVNLSTFLPGWGSGTLAVEIAWGADLTADAGTWSWTDITTDVRVDPGINVKVGRGDEASASQPAECSMVLDNQGGDYSLGGRSPNWPNVRRGTPVRVLIDPDGSGALTVFFGYATGFTPAWDSLTGQITTVALGAAGVLRRLGQGQSPVASTMRRALSNDPTVIAYWPCEEGKEATAFAPAVGPSFLTWYDVDPDLSVDATLPSSLALPVLKGSSWIAGIPVRPATGVIELSAVWVFPTDDQEHLSSILAVKNTGTVAVVRAVYGSGGELQLWALDAVGGVLGFTAAAFDLTSPPLDRRFILTMTQDGGDVDMTYGTVDRYTGAGSFGILTVAGTLGSPWAVTVNEPWAGGGQLDAVAIGHIAVAQTAGGLFGNALAFAGFAGETPRDRIERLCDENGEAVEVVGHTSGWPMGPQTPGTLLELLRECETADGGVLLDGLDQGLTYLCADQRENRPVDLTVDAGGGQLAPPFAPVDDDQRTRNRAEVTRQGAGTFVHEDTSGPLGTDAIGTYDTSSTVNLRTDAQAQAYAEWLVARGTYEGAYRYPAVAVDHRATPALTPGALALHPSSRIDLADVDDALTAHPGHDIELIVEGVELEIAAGTLRSTLACSPAPPWAVGVLATDTASPIAYIGTGAAGIGNNASVATAFPAGLANYDLLLIVASIRNSGTGTVDVPDGWTALLTSGNVAVLGMVRDFTDAAPTVTFTGGAAGATTFAQLSVYRGTGAHRLADLADVVHASAAQLNASAQDIATPAITITEDNCLAIVGWWKADDSTAVVNPHSFPDGPPDMSSTLGSDASLGIDQLVQSAATSYGSGTATVTGGAPAISRGFMLALSPDPTPPPAVRLDTDASTLNGAISAAATSISVTTTSGPLWTTDALDFPFDLDVGGERITVTACADATSPQTMTIDPAPVARSSGVPVKLWDPPGLSR